MSIPGPCGMAALLLASVAAAQTSDAARVEQLLSTYQYPAAVSAARGMVQNFEGSDTLDYARALDLLGRAEAKAGTPFAETSKILNRALDLKTSLAGSNSHEVAVTLNLLGAQTYTARDFKNAQALFERSLAIEPNSLDALNGVGRALSALQQTARALELHQRALGFATREFGPSDRRTANVLYLLATDYREGGDVVKAQDFYSRAVHVLEADPTADKFELAVYRANLAMVYRERGELTLAKSLFEDALRTEVKILGANHPQLVPLYNNFGLDLKALGEYKESRALFDRALDISRGVNGEDSPITAQLLGNLGIVLVESGDLLAARDCYERALAIQEKRLGPDHQLVAAVVYSLGNVQHQMGDLVEAKRLVTRALAIYEKALGPENPKTAQVLGTLGTLNLDLGEFAAARANTERSYRIQQKTMGDKNSNTSFAFRKTGDVRLAAGDAAGALEIYRTTLRNSEEEYGKDNPQTALAVEKVAAAEAALGHHAEALASYTRASDIWNATFGKDFYLQTEAHAGRGKALAALGRDAEALAAALESARVRRENVRIGARGIAERQALLYASQNRAGLELALDLSAQGKVPPADLATVWDALIRDRSLVLDEMIQRRNLAARTSDASMGALWKDVSDAREQLARAAVRETDAPGRAAQMIALRNAVDQAERKLALQSTAFRRQQESGETGYVEVRAALPSNSALVGYARTANAYLALVAGPGNRNPVAVKLGSAGAIEKLVSAWRGEMDRERAAFGRAAARNEAAYRAAGTALRRAIWDPITPHIAGARRIYVTGDSVLLLVNPATLPAGESGYLVETAPPLQMLSTERDLLKHSAPHSTNALLAIGNPEFATASANTATHPATAPTCSGFGTLWFDPLPASATEAQSIASLWRARGGRASELEGARANETAVKQFAPGKRVIHIATHGFFVDERCGGAAVLRENPLLRSGLALAGANRRASATPGKDDGILTAEEVASLDLTGTELVVLSGCDTGVGVAQTGEGVLGLRRAFRIAGAQTLVTSLWPVADEDTRLWMLALYRARFAGRTTADAARDATLEQLHARRAAHKSTHPLYWGGFIAVGSE